MITAIRTESHRTNNKANAIITKSHSLHMKLPSDIVPNKLDEKHQLTFERKRKHRQEKIKLMGSIRKN